MNTSNLRFAPELTGIACGVAGGWFAAGSTPEQLAMIIAAASACAGAIGAVLPAGGVNPGAGPQSGIRAGVLTALVGGGSAVLGATLQSTSTGFATVLPAVLTIPPGAFFGVVGALVISMVRNARTHSAERTETPRESKQVGALVAVVCLSLCGYLSPLIALQVPRSNLVNHETRRPPGPEPIEKPPPLVPPEPPAPPPWRYTAVKEFPTARPATIKILRSVPLGDFGAPLRSAFANDKTTLAFGAPNTEIVIVDLNVPEEKTSIWLSETARRFGFSPDNKRLFCVSDGNRFVASLGKVIPLPLPSMIPPGDLEWNEETRIFVGSSVIDLDTLQVSTGKERPPSVAAAHPHFELREVYRVAAVHEGNVRTESAYALVDKQRDYSVTIALRGERPRLSPDGTKVLSEQNGQLIATYFDVTESRARKFTVKMGASMPSALADSLKERRLLAVLCAPIVNPLNEKVVGADLARVKGIVGVESWDGAEAIFWTKEDYDQPVSDGDTVGHLMMINGDRRVRVSGFDGWWSQVSNVSAAAAPERLPEPQAEAIQPARPPAPADSNNAEHDEPMAELLRAFVRAHHEKSSAGDVDGLAANYALRVDHLNGRMVSREDIRKEERAYHAPGTRITETPASEISIVRMSENLYRANYSLRFEQVRATGAWVRGLSDIELIIDTATASPVLIPQIVKQRAVQREKQTGR